MHPPLRRHDAARVRAPRTAGAAGGGSDPLPGQRRRDPRSCELSRGASESREADRSSPSTRKEGRFASCPGPRRPDPRRSRRPPGRCARTPRPPRVRSAPRGSPCRSRRSATCRACRGPPSRRDRSPRTRSRRAPPWPPPCVAGVPAESRRPRSTSPGSAALARNTDDAPVTIRRTRAELEQVDLAALRGRDPRRRTARDGRTRTLSGSRPEPDRVAVPPDSPRPAARAARVPRRGRHGLDGGRSLARDRIPHRLRRCGRCGPERTSCSSRDEAPTHLSIAPCSPRRAARPRSVRASRARPRAFSR